MSLEAGRDRIPTVLGVREKLLATQAQYQSPEIARTVAKGFGFDVAVAQRACKRGDPTGDFYRLMQKEGQLFILFGDAPKHGLLAARLVNRIHTTLTPDITDQIVQASSNGRGGDLTQSILYLDRHLRENKKHIGLQDDGIPMLMVGIDPVNKRIRNANAGLTTDVILLRNKHAARFFRPNGAPLGSTWGPDMDPAQEHRYAKGDILILMTDGMDDKSAKAGDEPPIEKIKKFISILEESEITPERLVKRIPSIISRASDDLTIMAIQL